MSEDAPTRESERLCRDFGRSLRALAHEVNNSLALVGAQAQFIEMKSGHYGLAQAEQEDLVHRLRVVRDAVRKCEGVFARYRLMYRPPSPEPKATSLAALVTQLADGTEAPQPSAALSIGVPPDVAVWADRSAVQLALDEVIRNARQATLRGGATAVSFTVDDESVSVMVVDGGVGMTPEVAARALDPYFSAWEGIEAAGIGLCIAQTALSSFGGSLSIASDGPGRGAVCTITLPLQR